MASGSWRLCILLAVLIVGLALLREAAASGAEIPPLRNKDSVRILTFIMTPTLDVIPPPLSSIPRNHPFKAVDLEVRGNEEILAEFARRAVEVRLEELGVADQIHVIHPSFPGADGHPSADVLSCEILRVTFVFNATAQEVEGRPMSIIAADMLATQQASEQSQDGAFKCLDGAPRPEWALQAGPHAVAVPASEDQAASERSRGLILYYIDNQIVPRILRSNKAAMETFRSWQAELLK